MSFDPQAATAAYIDSLGAETLARSAAYTVGSHWLLLWGLLVTIAVAWIIVRSRLLDRVEARLGRRGPGISAHGRSEARALRAPREGSAVNAFVVGVVYFLVAGALSLPWSLYRGWWRETSYGLSSQPFADALGQGLLGLAISSLLAALFFIGIYALIRRAGRRWWLWSGALAAAGISAVLLIAPVAIEPLFNDYRPVPEGPVRDAVVVLAKEAGIAPERIFVYDGSRQSNRFTANVSGIGPFARIALSDVALKGASLDEVRAVTAHEIGHYVLQHVWQRIALMSLLAMAAFFVVDRAYPKMAAVFGSRAPLASPTSLPVLMVLVSFLSLLATPLVNGFIRLSESQADRYSLQTANLPDALASALVKTAEYRDPRPHPLQEMLFYTHPAVERRVREAMQWKAAPAGKAPG